MTNLSGKKSNEDPKNHFIFAAMKNVYLITE